MFLTSNTCVYVPNKAPQDIQLSALAPQCSFLFLRRPLLSQYLPIGSMVLLYVVTCTINIPPMLAHIYHKYLQWIGLRENCNRKAPFFNGKIDGFRWRFSRLNQSIKYQKSAKPNAGDSYHLVVEQFAMEHPQNQWRFRSLGKSSINGPWLPWLCNSHNQINQSVIHEVPRALGSCLEFLDGDGNQELPSWHSTGKRTFRATETNKNLLVS